jgi:cytochrome o ubiquinol oxidase operon protein cyoD
MSAAEGQAPGLAGTAPGHGDPASGADHRPAGRPGAPGHHDHGAHDHHDALHGHGDEHGHGSLRSYTVGFVLSVILTVIPFWLVMSGVLANPPATAAIIIAMAVAQIIVHTVCFLHVNARGEGGWTLMAYLFTAVLVLITIGGSLWIMYHLHSNMMPGMTTGSTALSPP